MSFVQIVNTFGWTQMLQPFPLAGRQRHLNRRRNNAWEDYQR